MVNQVSRSDQKKEVEPVVKVVSQLNYNECWCLVHWTLTNNSWECQLANDHLQWEMLMKVENLFSWSVVTFTECRMHDQFDHLYHQSIH